MNVESFLSSFISSPAEESQIDREIEILNNLESREILISECLEEHAYFY
jgi:hypothetical protein